MTDDEFKSFQGAEAISAYITNSSGQSPQRLDAGAINALYQEHIEDEPMAEFKGIPNTAWERQVRALDDEGHITFVSRA